MSYKKTILILAISFMVTNFFLQAQSVDKEIKDLTYKAYLMKSKTFWEEAIQKSKIYAKKNDDTSESQLLYINSLYGILNSTMTDKDKETYNKYIDAAEDAIDEFIEVYPDDARIICIKTGLYSIKMAHFPWKGMFYGPKSEKLISKAIILNPELPQTWIRKASSEFFTPEAFGGNIIKSMETYQKAVRLFEVNEQDLSTNWEYLDALAWFGISQMKNQKYKEAQETFEKALLIQPNFRWIKNVLLPEVISLVESNQTSNNKASEF